MVHRPALRTKIRLSALIALFALFAHFYLAVLLEGYGLQCLRFLFQFSRRLFSSASMTAIVHDLIEKRLVVESGRESSTLGRKPVSLSIRSDAAYLLGIDLGTYRVRVVIADMNGKVLYKRQAETQLNLNHEGRAFRTRYSQARSALGFCPHSSLSAFHDVQGRALDPGELANYLQQLRRVRLNTEFNAEICRGLLAVRSGAKQDGALVQIKGAIASCPGLSRTHF